MVELQLSEWLKPADVGTNDKIVVFLNEGAFGEFIKKDGSKKPTFEIKVALDEKVSKTWTMNPTSQTTIANILGKNTKAWIGKKAILFLADQNIDGVMKKVIYARGVSD